MVYHLIRCVKLVTCPSKTFAITILHFASSGILLAKNMIWSFVNSSGELSECRGVLAAYAIRDLTWHIQSNE